MACRIAAKRELGEVVYLRGKMVTDCVCGAHAARSATRAEINENSNHSQADSDTPPLFKSFVTRLLRSDR